MPIALSIPDGVSHMRGVGLPRHGTRVMDLTMTPPSLERSTNAWASRPAPKVPDAASTGLESLRPPSSTLISTADISVPRRCELVGRLFHAAARRNTCRRQLCLLYSYAFARSVPDDVCAVEHGPLRAGTRVENLVLLVLASSRTPHGHHAGHTHTESTCHQFFDRDLDGQMARHACPRHGCQHRMGSARIDDFGVTTLDGFFHDVGNAPLLARAAVFCGDPIDGGKATHIDRVEQEPRVARAENEVDAMPLVPELVREKEQWSGPYASSYKQ